MPVLDLANALWFLLFLVVCLTAWPRCFRRISRPPCTPLTLTTTWAPTPALPRRRISLGTVGAQCTVPLCTLPSLNSPCQPFPAVTYERLGGAKYDHLTIQSHLIPNPFMLGASDPQGEPTLAL
jgi:hypothetical protein